MSDTAAPNRGPLGPARFFVAVIVCSVALAAAWAGQPAATAQEDYYEYFYSVSPYAYDSDSDGYNDSVTLEMDVDTTGGYVDVAVDAYLEDAYGYVADADFAIWTIYGEDSEAAYVDLTLGSGSPGYYYLYLDLYDVTGWEDDWAGSVYLYPVGYGTTSIPTATFRPTATQSQAQSYPSPSTFVFHGDGGLSGGAVGGIVAGTLLIVLSGIFWTSRRLRRKTEAQVQVPAPAPVVEKDEAFDDRIAKFKAKMERWRKEGYDVSELEDLFR